MWDEYPWNQERELKKIIGKYYNLNPSKLILGFGSDELTNFLFMTQALKQSRWMPLSINIKEYSYPMLMQYVENFNYRIDEEAQLEHWTIRKEKEAEGISHRIKDMWIDCVHADKETIQQIVREIDYNHILNLRRKECEIKYQKILIGSFSKRSFNLPGLRLGFLYSDKYTINHLKKYRPGLSIHSYSYKIIKEKLHENN